MISSRVTLHHFDIATHQTSNQIWWSVHFYQRREHKLYKWFFSFVFYQIGFVDPEGRVVDPFSFSFIRNFLVIPDAVPASLAAAGPLRVVSPSGSHSISMFYKCNSLPFYKRILSYFTNVFVRRFPSVFVRSFTYLSLSLLKLSCHFATKNTIQSNNWL